MMEKLNILFLMDGNGPFVWSCLLLLILILFFNIFSAFKIRKKMVRSLTQIGILFENQGYILSWLF